MNQHVVDLKRALLAMNRDDFDDLTIEQLGMVERDLDTWSCLIMTKRIEKLAAIRDEASE